MIRFTRALSRLAPALLLAAVLGSAGHAQEAPRLDSPVDCVLGEICFVQFLVDRDPGPGVLDYGCGGLTYNGHKGTDFRIPDLVVMAAGVSVIAAAEGVVRAVRVGMPDISANDVDAAVIAGREAGNAVVITHPGGWESQYAHLREGSVLVRSGDRVSVGQPLGLIGMSGKANYPHLHFELRHEGIIVDPFTGESAFERCKPAGPGLWTPDAAALLAYRPGGVLNVGFAGAIPDRDAVRNGADRALVLPRSLPVLVLWADVFGLQAGDEEVFRIYAPDGRLLVEHRERLDNAAHQRFQYAGLRAPEGGWPAGNYTGIYELMRLTDGVLRPALRAERRLVLE